MYIYIITSNLIIYFFYNYDLNIHFSLLSDTHWLRLDFFVTSISSSDVTRCIHKVCIIILQRRNRCEEEIEKKL